MISLPEIFAAVREALQLILNLVGLANIIKGNTDKAAQENVPFTIDTNTSETNAAVTDGTIGLLAIKTAIDTLTSNQATEFADIMAAIAALPQTTTPALLPSLFPSSWNLPLGDAVWGWPTPSRNNPAYTYLTDAGDMAEYLGIASVQYSTPLSDAMWTVSGNWQQDAVADPNPLSTFTLDVSTILPSDATSADWLNRVYPSQPWQTFNVDGTLSLADINSANWNWNVNLPIDKWLQLKANLGLTAAAVAAPLWPGVANVTLGSTTALTNGLMLTGPMDGVIVAILSAPPGKAKYSYGTINAFQHIAALSFTDDDGHQEHFQAIQFESQIYVPTTMVIAAGVIFRVDPAVTGTVTPWTNI